MVGAHLPHAAPRSDNRPAERFPPFEPWGDFQDQAVGLPRRLLCMDLSGLAGIVIRYQEPRRQQAFG